MKKRLLGIGLAVCGVMGALPTAEAATLTPPFTMTDGFYNYGQLVEKTGKNDWRFEYDQLSLDYDSWAKTDSWAFFPISELKSGGEYEVMIRVGGGWTEGNDYINVSFGTEPTAAAMTITAIERTGVDNSFNDLTGKVRVPETGAYYLGVHASATLPNQGNYFVSKIAMGEFEPSEGPDDPTPPTPPTPEALTPPYECASPFNMVEGLTTEVVSGNEWVLGEGGDARLQYNGSENQNTWFYTPGIELKAGAKYPVTLVGYDMFNEEDYMEVKFGKEANHSSMTGSAIPEFKLEWCGSSYEYHTYSGTIEPTEDGVYYIGMHAITYTPDKGILYIKSVKIGEDSSSAGPEVVAVDATVPMVWKAEDGVGEVAVDTPDVELTSSEYVSSVKIQLSFADGVPADLTQSAEVFAQFTNGENTQTATAWWSNSSTLQDGWASAEGLRLGEGTWSAVVPEGSFTWTKDGKEYTNAAVTVENAFTVTVEALPQVETPVLNYENGVLTVTAEEYSDVSVSYLIWSNDYSVIISEETELEGTGKPEVVEVKYGDSYPGCNFKVMAIASANGKEDSEMAEAQYIVRMALKAPTVEVEDENTLVPNESDGTFKIVEEKKVTLRHDNAAGLLKYQLGDAEPVTVDSKEVEFTVPKDENISRFTLKSQVVPGENDQYWLASPEHEFDYEIAKPSLVNLVEADGSDLRVFTLDGHEVNARDIESGVYVVVSGNKTSKVLVK